MTSLDFPVGPKERRGRMNGNEQRMKGIKYGQVVKIMETPMFLPFIKESVLRKALKEVDEVIGEATGSPSLRFVGCCGGGTLIDLLGDSSLWTNEWTCGW